MSAFPYERYCSEIVSQTGLLRAAFQGADLSAPVPTCPDWTLADLLLHLGTAHRNIEKAARERAREPLADAIPLTPADGPDPADADALDVWLADGARTLARTLRDAGPDARIQPFGIDRSAAFWARRAAHETVIHRADAAATTGADYTVDAALAADCLDEWLEMVSLIMTLGIRPELKDLLGPGRTIHLHTTDTPPEAEGEWFLDLTGDGIAWRHAHEKAAVAVRGPVADVLRVLYRRLPVDFDTVTVAGDRGVLDLWLEKARF
ncbi:maleylpyruvate isomerase N-terminal domain-containing protein [Streptomyces sp. NPDC002536]